MTNVKRGAATTLLFNIVNSLLPFIVRTCMVKYLGDNYLGLSGLCLSIISVLNASELGLDMAMSHRLYAPIERNDVSRINCLLAFYKKVYFFIGIIVLLMGIAIMPFLNMFAKDNIPINTNIYIIFALYLLGTCLSYWMVSYKVILLVALQRIDLRMISVTVSFGIMYIAQIIAIINRKYGIYAVMIPIEPIMQGLIINTIYKRKYPEFIAKGNVEKELKDGFIKEIFYVAVYRLREITRNSFDSIVISLFLGLTYVGMYQNYYLVFSLIVIMRSICVSSVTPSLGNYFVSHEKEEVYRLYKIILFIQMFLSGWFGLCFYYLIEDFVVIWLGSEHLLKHTIAVLFMIYYVACGIPEVFKMLRSTSGFWEKGRTVALIEMVLNIILNIVLGYFYGMNGIMIGTIFTVLFINVPSEMLIVVKGFFNQTISDSIFLILSVIIWLTGNIIAIHFCVKYIPDIYIWKIIIKAIICFLLPPLTFVLLFWKKEEFQKAKAKLIKNSVGASE